MSLYLLIIFPGGLETGPSHQHATLLLDKCLATSPIMVTSQ